MESTDNDSLLGMQNPIRLKEPDNTAEMIRKIQSESVVEQRDLSGALGREPSAPAANFAANITKEGIEQAQIRQGIRTAAALSAEERQERLRILARLSRLSNKPGFPPIQYQANDSLAELRRKNNIATYAGRSQFAVDMMRRSTIFLAKGAESIAKMYPTEYVDLDGYSAHLYTTINSYDNMLHDIYDYYGDAFGEVNPILTYLTAIGSNMMMYSISRKMVKAKDRLSSGFRKRGPPQRHQSPPPKRRRPGYSAGDMSGPESDTEGDARTTISFETVATELKQREFKEKPKTHAEEEQPHLISEASKQVEMATTSEQIKALLHEQNQAIAHNGKLLEQKHAEPAVESMAAQPISAERAAGIAEIAPAMESAPPHQSEQTAEARLKIDINSLSEQ